ncbi:MAG: hypothetical protein LBE08_12855 [Bifidobacteriaceae bacterium]|nr:hypothetical protein [Bifidobacteriaceae bacterium]
MRPRAQAAILQSILSTLANDQSILSGPVCVPAGQRAAVGRAGDRID